MERSFRARARPMIDLVAIDGTVGVGKSSVAGLLAERLGWQHLDTGAMYRAVALLASRAGASLEDEASCGRVARAMSLQFRPAESGQTVLADGEDVTDAIRSHEVTQAVSAVADRLSVREALGAMQKKMGTARPSVAEGRDMGTVVFPDARWKFFLDADPAERASRRGLQLEAEGNPLPMEQLLSTIAERDRRDRTRPVGALAVASDAIVVDTTGMDLERVVALLEQVIRADLTEPS